MLAVEIVLYCLSDYSLRMIPVFHHQLCQLVNQLTEMELVSLNRKCFSKKLVLYYEAKMKKLVSNILKYF